MNITEALKTDIAHIKDLIRSPSADIGTISGLPNLKRALFHRLITVPGTLVHRPTYGVGILMYQNSISSFTVQQKIADLIKEQFELDPRIEKVTRMVIGFDDDSPELTFIRVAVQPIGYTEETMIFTPFDQGAA